MVALTVADVKRRVKRKFGDEAGVQVSDTDIIDWINDAQDTVVKVNDSIHEKTAVANSVANQQEYSFPADMLKFKMMSYKGSGGVSYTPLQGMTVVELNMYIDGWDENTSTAGSPLIYAVHANKFLVYPVPTESITGAFKIYYCRKPSAVALDADVLDLPEVYHRTVVDLVLQDAFEMDEDWEAAAAKSSQVGSELKGLRSSDEWMRRDTYPIITVRDEDL